MEIASTLWHSAGHVLCCCVGALDCTNLGFGPWLFVNLCDMCRYVSMFRGPYTKLPSNRSAEQTAILLQADQPRYGESVAQVLWSSVLCDMPGVSGKLGVQVLPLRGRTFLWPQHSYLAILQVALGQISNTSEHYFGGHMDGYGSSNISTVRFNLQLAALGLQL